LAEGFKAWSDGNFSADPGLKFWLGLTLCRFYQEIFAILAAFILFLSLLRCRKNHPMGYCHCGRKSQSSHSHPIH
jgi:hypothetical protein